MSFIKIRPTSQRDGTPNADWNCVAEVVNVGVGALTGVYKGADWWKTMAYGAKYQGATAAIKYVPFAAQLGVRLFAIAGSNPQLTKDIHEQLAMGHPVIATEPDWISPGHPEWSHVVLFNEDTVNTEGAMDPWNAAEVVRTDSAWQGLFEFGEVWAMEKIGVPTVATNVPKGWSVSADKKTLTAPNGVIAVLGFEDKILGSNWDPANMPLEREHSDGMAGTEQLCVDCMLRWNPKDGVTVHHLSEDVLAQRAQISTLQAQVQGLIAQVKAAQQIIPAEVVGALRATLSAMADASAAVQHALNVQPPAPPLNPAPLAEVAAQATKG
jgi:hypothetical protein